MTSFYSDKELKEMGFKYLGNNVNISRKASIYNIHSISIGDNVRIDDFCILSGNITLGRNIHIAAYCCLFAGEYGIEMKDFSGLSSRCAVYALTDDYSGLHMTNPTVPDKYRNVFGGQVTIGRHSLIGTGSTILPGINIGEGVSVGSMSLINKDLSPWGIYIGIPCRKLKDRKKDLLQLECEYLSDQIS